MSRLTLLNKALAPLGRYSWTELLEHLGPYDCALACAPDSEDHQRWVVSQIDNSSYGNATPIGMGNTPGRACISALFTLCGMQDDGHMAIEDHEVLTLDTLDELREAHNTLARFLSERETPDRPMTQDKS